MNQLSPLLYVSRKNSWHMMKGVEMCNSDHTSAWAERDPRYVQLSNIFPQWDIKLQHQSFTISEQVVYVMMCILVNVENILIA